MKKYFLLILLALPALLPAQEYDIKFENGETKKVVFDYDDPNHLPPFNMTYSFLGFSVIGEGMLSFQLRPEYRFTDKLMASACYTTAYSRGLDENITYNSSYQDLMKKTSAFSLMGHYSLYSFDSPVKKKVAVDYGGDAVYIARLPRIIAKTIVVQGGIDHIRTPANMGLESTPETTDTSFRALNFSSLSAVIGVSLYRHQSYSVTSNGVSRSYFRYSRFFADLTFGLSSNYETYGVVYSGSSVTTYEASAGFVTPSNAKLGWRVGWQRHMGAKNSTFNFSMGFTYGQIPHLFYTSTTGTKVTSPDELFMVHFGAGLGTRYKK